jgi:hypothetical protein
MPATSLRFDIADPHLQMPLPVLTAADEGRVQGHHDRRRRRFRLDRGTLSKSRTGFQGLAAEGLRVLRGVLLIRRELDAVGRTEDTAVTAFTDGCPELRRILADAGVTTTPILDGSTSLCGFSTSSKSPPPCRLIIRQGWRRKR